MLLLNAVDPGRFPRLLSRLLQRLHLKVGDAARNRSANAFVAFADHLYSQLLVFHHALGLKSAVGLEL